MLSGATLRPPSLKIAKYLAFVTQFSQLSSGWEPTAEAWGTVGSFLEGGLRGIADHSGMSLPAPKLDMTRPTQSGPRITCQDAETTRSFKTTGIPGVSVEAK